MLISSQYELHAAHIIGGEFLYKCLGNGKYKITLIIYRDNVGQGAPFDSQGGNAIAGTVSIFRGNNGDEFRKVILDAPIVTNIDPNNTNPCLIVPDDIAVQEGIYEFEITLPVSTESYHIVYSRCCRNENISNIVNADNTGATYYIEITPEAQTMCNSSPRFNDFPPIAICANEALSFDHSATDPDGTAQLVYEFCTPYRGGGIGGTQNGDPPDAAFKLNGVAPDPDAPPPHQDIQWVFPPYSENNPMGGAPTVSIDPNTGLITGIPTTVGRFVVGVCVKEYVNGVLISTVKRDFQFNVTNCQPTVVAKIKADKVIDGEEFFIISCGENTVFFENESYLTQFIQTYHWTFDLGGGNIEKVNTQNAEITFPGIGNYYGKLVLNAGLQCADSLDLYVDIFPDITADFEFDYDTCIAGPVIFTNTSVTGAGEITESEWDFGDGEFSLAKHPNHTYQIPGILDIELTVRDINECEETIIKPIHYFPVPSLIVVEPSTFIGCAPAKLFFNNLSVPIDSTYDITWDFGDGNLGFDISPTHIYEKPGVYSIHLDIISPIGCATEADFPNWIEVRESPVAGFTYTPENPSNFNSELSFFDESLRAVAWNWFFDQEGVSLAQNPVFNFQDTGFKEVMQVVIHENGCTDTLRQIIDIEPKVTYFLPNAFTPNFDGKNDVYKGKGVLDGMKGFSLSIWNRWGSKIFETNDPNQGWDGSHSKSGKISPPGVYVAKVRYVNPRGKVIELTGFATLIK